MESACLATAAGEAAREAGHLEGVHEKLKAKFDSLEIQIEGMKESFQWGEYTLRELEENLTAPNGSTDFWDPFESD